MTSSHFKFQKSLSIILQKMSKSNSQNSINKIPQDRSNITRNYALEINEAKDSGFNKLLDLQNEAKTMQQKIKETEQDYRAVSDLLSNQRKLVIEAEMRLEMVTQELQSIKQQCEVLKIRNVDHLTSNEGLDTLKQFSKAWNTGLSGRQQKINFDQILKDVLGNYTVDSLLNDRHEKISVFDPLREKRSKVEKVGKNWEGTEKLMLSKVKTSKLAFES